MVAEFSRRLDVAGIVDRHCPVRDVAILSHGQVIEALVANRLTSPALLVRVEDWAKAWAVEEVFGVVAETRNDDRVGRALDAVAPHLDVIVGSVGARAISDFGIDVSRLHRDTTSISLVGDSKLVSYKNLAAMVKLDTLPPTAPTSGTGSRRSSLPG